MVSQHDYIQNKFSFWSVSGFVLRLPSLYSLADDLFLASRLILWKNIFIRKILRILDLKKGGDTAKRHNCFSTRNLYPVNPVCVFSVINSRQKMNLIWQLLNDVNLINEHKKKQVAKRYGYIQSFGIYL